MTPGKTGAYFVRNSKAPSPPLAPEAAATDSSPFKGEVGGGWV